MLFFLKKSRFCDRGRQHFAATLNIILAQVPDNAKPMSTRMLLDRFWIGFLEMCFDIILIHFLYYSAYRAGKHLGRDLENG